MKKLSLTIIAAMFSIALFSQDFEVPKNYKLEKVEDYAVYEKDVVNCFNWLMKTPPNQQADKRKEANAFLLKWMTGSPNVKLEIKPGIVTFMENPDIFMMFLGGWTKYSLESKDFKNKVAGNMAGIEAIIEFYTKHKAFLKKDKNVEKYIKMNKKGKLEDYIKKNAQLFSNYKE